MWKPITVACLATSAAIPLLHALEDAKPAGPKASKSSLVADGRLQELAWLAGEWRGKAGDTDVVEWHSDPKGGMIVMATKELSGGKASLFDFGVISERAEAIAFVPYPYGKPSVPFLLEGHDPKVKRARFVNAAHDFPQSFTFTRDEKDGLTIVLEGVEKGEARRIEYTLALVRARSD